MAGPYPLDTLACVIGPNGISAPAFEDIINSLIASYTDIFGSDVYLTPDTQDYQWIAIMATAINDVNNATIAAYLSFSPTYAQGAGLSSQVKINGIQREASSASSADLTLIGQGGTQIINGVVNDEAGNAWALPALVTIPPGGMIVQTATCTTQGAIQAAAGSISQIANPQRGWQSATNPIDAVVGAPVETDATLRKRQALSVAGPAQTVNASIVAAVANIAGVQAVRLYENNTNAVDANGIPRNSVCVVVLGGNAVEIATAISLHKPPGTGTFGNITEVVKDQANVTNSISFQTASVINLHAELDLKALTNFVSPTGDAAAQACAAYVSALGIGPGDVYLTKFQAAALSVPNSDTFNLTLAKIGRQGGPLAAADLPMAFNEFPNLRAADISVVVT